VTDMDIVKEVLSKIHNEKGDASNRIKVDKLIDPQFSSKNLTLHDTNGIDNALLRDDNRREEYLLNLARGNTQYLINALCCLPREPGAGGGGEMVIRLADDSQQLPREKPVPVPKPLTKWEKFAKEKGIRKKKKEKSTWDDILQRWVPNYGYRRAAAEKQRDWLLEVPGNVDPNTDMFAKKEQAKKERVARNEYQRLRNIAAARKVKVPSVGVPPLESNMHVPQLDVAAKVARISTASLGKFQASLPREKPLKAKEKFAKKRKANPLLNSEQERQANLAVVEAIARKKPRLNVERAVNRNIHEEQLTRKYDKSEDKKMTKGAPKFKSKGSFKRPKSGKGKHVGKSGKVGRKRR